MITVSLDEHEARVLARQTDHRIGRIRRLAANAGHTRQQRILADELTKTADALESVLDVIDGALMNAEATTPVPEVIA